MNRKKLLVIGGLKPSAVHVLAVALLSLMVIGGSQIHNNIVRVQAATMLVVDDDGFASATNCNDTTPTYMTISAAVAAASSGDTIKVCPGIYNEQVTIDKTLTLQGAQAGMDARTRLFVAANESIINDPCGPVQIEADKV